MRNLKCFYYLREVGVVKGQEERSHQENVLGNDHLSKVFDEFCDCGKLSCWRSTGLGTWAEKETSFGFWPESKRRRGMYLPFNATDYVMTHITRLKTCLILTRLLGLLYCELPSGNTKLKTSSNQKNLKQVGWVSGTTRTKYSSGERKKKRCPIYLQQIYKMDNQLDN